MEILTFPLGQLGANCYFLIKDNKCLIIDPADEANFILEEIQRRKLEPVAMLATHGHFDHIMAAGEIQITLVETGHAPSLPLYIHNKDLFLIKRLRETAKHFLGYELVIIEPKIIKPLEEGNFNIDDFQFEVILCPGHTPGGVSFYFKDEKVVFTGDTLFKDGIGRYDFSYCSFSDLKKSLRSLFKLPEETVVNPGHGEVTTIGEEMNRLPQ